ncbi:Uncharacterised protein [Klebsiella pneumoniae]|nr:Uncharacterised protein [Klebsiella pneumoniae]
MTNVTTPTTVNLIQSLTFQRFTIPSDESLPHNFRKVCTATMLD